MKTLKATEGQSQALYRHKITERARIVRGRVEAVPGAGQQAKMDSVDNRIRLAHYTLAADLMDHIDQALDRHRQSVEAAHMAAAGHAQDQLLAERGTETFEVGSVRSRDGWLWLKARKRLTSAQSDAGDKFGALYRGATRDTLSTSANDNGGESKVDAMDVYSAARQKLAAVKRHITGATGAERLFDLLVNVCGRGDTLRSLAGGDDRLAGCMEADLKTALDMASVAMKGSPRA